MTADSPAEAGWFAGLEPDDPEAAAAAIAEETAPDPADWPKLAVEAGFANDAKEYYDRLKEATTAATREAVERAERADDRQLVHAVRTMDDCQRTANELAERLAEWAGTIDPDAGAGVDYARELVADDDADRDGGVDHPRIVSLAERVVALADEAEALREYVERETPTVAPNLAALAGPVLAARLISLAGGLEPLAKKPSGTVQVLGAEDALFAHLRGHASSPKHGIIYTHDAVRGTHPDERGSAARAVAGKLSIAARVDHYSGERKPELEAELEERIETIQSRTDDGEGGESGGDDE
ncbi:Pre-mRNA processing ribonucleoprotein, binding domain-containing protein [Natronococcus amylolyticus DSM 10524]|uniref:Pre-mRNA processing ribonucleoprotein, binding domain-containing protein n=1 Tax=Natronococcus amylolyticus DSM 10524 TaxID=1227497 RepID=L9WZT7_9EURY|nr:NOP5/NOP56 family protein [Natronococcus amylolyticus]ELY53883.1 Pre-mRNA processing ribonucleoprotein, binding domain-containing protein [Natronococcus amylolyticus DSM 10524]